MKKKVVSIAVTGVALILFGVGAGADNDTPGDGERGVCNAIIAGGLGAAQQFVHAVGDPVEQCEVVGEALGAFLETEGCFEAFVAGELRGLGGAATTRARGPNAGELTPLGEVICGALCGCGFFPELPAEICTTFDCP